MAARRRPGGVAPRGRERRPVRGPPGPRDTGVDLRRGDHRRGDRGAGLGAIPVTRIREHATSGDFTFHSSDGGRRGAVVGALLASRLGAYPGATLTLVTASGASLNPVLGAVIPRFMTFEVTGVFTTGMFEYDNAYIYVDLAVGQEFAGLDTAVTGLEVQTTDRWSRPRSLRRSTRPSAIPIARSIGSSRTSHSSAPSSSRSSGWR